MGFEVKETPKMTKEQELLKADIDIKNLVIDAITTKSPGWQIADSIVSGEVTRTIEGASTVTITIHDQARKILAIPSGLYDKDGDLKTIDIHLDGLWFRLAQLRKQGDEILLQFEDRDVARLRILKGPRKAANRAKVTRAEYILQLIRSVKQHRIPVRINELHKKQPIGKYTAKERAKLHNEDPDEKRSSGGFPAGTKIRGVTPGQRNNMAVSLRVAEDLGASERVMLAMLVAGWGESHWRKSAAEHVYGTHKGVFQSNQIPASDLEAQTHHFLVGGRSFRAGGAIGAVKHHPTWTLGKIAQYVEISDGQESYYNSFGDIARRCLKAWGGGGGGSTSVTTKKKYQYKVDKKESYWDAIQRMAKDVNWRAFMTSGIFYYISEEDLFKTRVRYVLDEGEDGVYNIDFDWDYRKKVVKASATVRIDRWAVPPGTIVKLEGLGPASAHAGGKWLVESVTRNLFSPEATLNLKKPMHEKKEPKNELETKTTDSGGDGKGSGKWMWPTTVHRLTSPFGQRGGRLHDGIDIGVSSGTPVHAVDDGKVVNAGWYGGYGNYVAINHGKGIVSFYGHNSRIKTKTGKKVNKGDVIALSGNTGHSTGPHLHFGYHHNGQPRDPRNRLP